MPKFVPYVLGLFGVLFFAAALVLFYGQVLRGRKEAEAEILSGAVESFQQSDENSTGTFYRPRYQVRYMAGGRLFTISVASPTGTARDAAEARLHNNIGSRLPLYYLPSQPENVTLDPLHRRAGAVLLFLTVALTILGVAAILWYSSRPVEW